MHLSVVVHIIVNIVLGHEDKPPASLTDTFHMTEEDSHRMPVILVRKKLGLNVCAAYKSSETPFHLPS
jgi:hypothetical protein